MYYLLNLYTAKMAHESNIEYKINVKLYYTLFHYKINIIKQL